MTLIDNQELLPNNAHCALILVWIFLEFPQVTEHFTLYKIALITLNEGVFVAVHFTNELLNISYKY